MKRRRIDAKDWTKDDQKDVRVMLEGLRRDADVIVYGIEEQTWSSRVSRHLIACIAQHADRGKEQLLIWGCPLGMPPRHESGAYRRSFNQMLAKLPSDDFWTEREKNIIRSFIERQRR